MSVGVLRPAAATSRLLPRLLVAAAALLLVAGAVAMTLGILAPVIPKPPSRNPFGMGMREAAPSAAGLGGVILAWQAAFYTSLRTALATLKSSGTGLPVLVAVGFAYGVFHAAGPGHGKAIIASYIVSNERALRRGLLISLAAALIQALVAIALVTAVFLAVGGTAATLSRTANVVELSGFAVVSLLGAVLVWRKAGKVVGLADERSAQAALAADPCACGHIDPAEAARGSLGQMAAVAIGAGIRPCAGAIVVLTFARAQGLFAAGIAAVLAMALGTALTTGALAALAVYARRAALRLASGRGTAARLAGAAAELAAAAFVLVVGLALLAGIWEAGAS